jgi:hypothetical protein
MMSGKGLFKPFWGLWRGLKLGKANLSVISVERVGAGNIMLSPDLHSLNLFNTPFRLLTIAPKTRTIDRQLFSPKTASRSRPAPNDAVSLYTNIMSYPHQETSPTHSTPLFPFLGAPFSHLFFPVFAARALDSTSF